LGNGTVTVEEAVHAFLRLGIADADGLTKRELSAARRRLALKYHPDRSGGDGLEFQRINAAYKILTEKFRPRQPAIS
jgi:curved DNA-binding protein CbpA